MCLLQYGETVLHKASSEGRHETIQLLLDSGISVDIRNNVSSYI